MPWLQKSPNYRRAWQDHNCPELNPQEHVWKATREAVSHNYFKTKLTELAEIFEQHLTKTRFPCSLLDKHNYTELCAMFK
ncbi:MAG: hypothetical protein H7308_16035 [Chthonomonadaceae bacterium]|nr:hypothetical protein [Chthonomonadaceae bacterium]